jgi:hypothetical protein
MQSGCHFKIIQSDCTVLVSLASGDGEVPAALDALKAVRDQLDARILALERRLANGKGSGTWRKGCRKRQTL